VKTLSQFLLLDDDTAVPASFQSGLLLRDGRTPKPAYAAYRLPIWLPTVRRHTVRVWALLRPAPAGQPASATIEYRRRGAVRWRTLKTVTTTERRNYLQTTVRVAHSGHLRIRYVLPDGTPAHSRAAAFRLRRR
jgi:hypothetical protein